MHLLFPVFEVLCGALLETELFFMGKVKHLRRTTGWFLCMLYPSSWEDNTSSVSLLDRWTGELCMEVTGDTGGESGTNLCGETDGDHGGAGGVIAWFLAGESGTDLCGKTDGDCGGAGGVTAWFLAGDKGTNLCGGTDGDCGGAGSVTAWFLAGDKGTGTDLSGDTHGDYGGGVTAWFLAGDKGTGTNLSGNCGGGVNVDDRLCVSFSFLLHSGLKLKRSFDISTFSGVIFLGLVSSKLRLPIFIYRQEWYWIFQSFQYFDWHGCTKIFWTISPHMWMLYMQAIMSNAIWSATKSNLIIDCT